MSSSLQERTLVVKGYDPEKTTKELLEELFIQGGPVRNLVFRPDHAFVEFEDKESVGYALALFKGLELFKRPLIIEPKLNDPSYFKYFHHLDLVYNNLMMERNLVANIIPPVQANLYNQSPPFINQQTNHYNRQQQQQLNRTMFIDSNILQQQSHRPSTSNCNIRHESGNFVTMDPDLVYLPQNSRANNSFNHNHNYHDNHRNNRRNNYSPYNRHSNSTDRFRPQPRNKRWSN